MNAPMGNDKQCGVVACSDLSWEKPDTVDSYGLCRAVLERMGSAIRLITLSTFSMDGFMADICSFRFLVKAASVGSCF